MKNIQELILLLIPMKYGTEHYIYYNWTDMYKIKNYSFKQAKKLNLTIKPSKSKGKKIDVYKNGTFIGSIGAIGYNDYPTYLELEQKGKVKKGTAEQRRKLYKIRHQKTRIKKYSKSWLADKILW